ncbi:GyrI-like domain-containing protein [Paenibacillus albus]|uniref:AraC family transcriptional regulator n=1 Tax=Paenibacillus albus TaxID=2495582 RepID=A0A3S9A6Y9_9BACL|nr:GyrI-like domain-containing protein [Paenibacillus albus]AZN41505.1 AraC family transcriptional regulator [Paenibacillus albus]
MQDVQVCSEPKTFTIYGVSRTHQEATNYSEDVQALMNQLWGEIGAKKLPHLGINHMIYSFNDEVIAGVELKPEAAGIEHSLKPFTITLRSYAHFKHIGPYDRLCDAYDRIRAAAAASGLKVTQPGIEVYGHWNEDSAKLETDIYQSVE